MINRYHVVLTIWNGRKGYWFDTTVATRKKVTTAVQLAERLAPRRLKATHYPKSKNAISVVDVRTGNTVHEVRDVSGPSIWWLESW